MYKVEIKVKAGKGGGGSSSFCREKYHPLGGPDGGDGGKGGDVYVRADENIADLNLFRHKTVFKANMGKNGGNQKKYGKQGEDLVIDVPPGTVIYKPDEGNQKKFVADLKTHGQKIMVARGGRGGLGNVHFATPTHQAPVKTTQGAPGEELQLILDHKIMVDVGILGLPNTGKSTFLSRISKAHPRIADYPFTTIEPVIGNAEIGEKLFTLAEVPGLIKGASNGKGLGNRFLSQVERAKVLIILLDASSMDIWGDYQMLLNELAAYDNKLGNKQQVITVNKMDTLDVSDGQNEIEQIFRRQGLPVYFISALSGQGVNDLIIQVINLMDKVEAEEKIRPEPEVIFRPKPMSRKTH
jgi:GTP-binding protein